MRSIAMLAVCQAVFFCQGCRPKTSDKGEASSARPASVTKTAAHGEAGSTADESGASGQVALPITKAVWQKASPTRREEIARKLVTDDSLVGLDESAVESALGLPDRRFERMIYSFFVDTRTPLGAVPGLMILLDRTGHVETVGSTGYPKGKIPEILPFDKQKWTDGDDYVRFDMAPSVWRSQLLQGLDRKQVRNLLGEPSETMPPMLMYKLGSTSGNNKRLGRTLTIWFEKGRVSRARIQD